ncbi:uncharacterized protein LOC141909989 [Tubulanus polymorphus]|uniref:uncharacterized protein LOC141909989 n=1 Tax=Tubulanus polymorphus TaxID=672921 RepID=UPI003DA37599
MSARELEHIEYCLTEQLNLMKSLIFRDFISSWYSTLSDNAQSATDANAIVADLFAYARRRLESVDRRELVVRVVDTYARHVAAIVDAEAFVRRQPKYRRRRRDAEFKKIATVDEVFTLNARWHPALGAPSEYLRGCVDVLAKVLLKSDLYACFTGREMLVDVLTSNVLEPLIARFATTSFIHEIVVKILTEDEDDDDESRGAEYEKDGVALKRQRSNHVLYKNDDDESDASSYTTDVLAQHFKIDVKNPSARSDGNTINATGRDEEETRSSSYRRTGDDDDDDDDKSGKLSCRKIGKSSFYIPQEAVSPSRELGPSSPSRKDDESSDYNYRDEQISIAVITTDAFENDDTRVDDRMKRPSRRKYTAFENIDICDVDVDATAAPAMILNKRRFTVFENIEICDVADDNGGDKSVGAETSDDANNRLTVSAKTERSTSSQSDYLVIPSDGSESENVYSVNSQSFLIASSSESKLGRGIAPSLKPLTGLAPGSEPADIPVPGSNPHLELVASSEPCTGLGADFDPELAAGSEEDIVASLPENAERRLGDFAQSASNASLFSLGGSSRRESAISSDAISSDTDSIASSERTEPGYHAATSGGNPPVNVPGQPPFFRNLKIPSTDFIDEKFATYNIEYESWHRTEDREAPVLISKTVKRRFREFVILQERLEDHRKYKKLLRGIKAPSKWLTLPFAKMDNVLIKQRQSFLEKYLQQIVSIETLALSSEVKEFLAYGRDAGLAFVKKPAESPARVIARTMSGMIDKLSTAVLDHASPNMINNNVLISRLKKPSSKDLTALTSDEDQLKLEFGALTNMNWQYNVEDTLDSCLALVNNEMRASKLLSNANYEEELNSAVIFRDVTDSNLYPSNSFDISAHSLDSVVAMDMMVAMDRTHSKISDCSVDSSSKIREQSSDIAAETEIENVDDEDVFLDAEESQIGTAVGTAAGTAVGTAAGTADGTAAGTADRTTDESGATENLSIKEVDSAPVIHSILELASVLTQGQQCFLLQERILQMFDVTLAHVVECYLCEKISDLTDLQSWVKYTTLLREVIWPPGGDSEETDATAMTDLDRLQLRCKARRTLVDFLPSVLPWLFGSVQYDHCIDTAVSSFDNERLNRHLIYCLLDVVMETLVPEIDLDSFHRQFLASTEF